MTHGDVALVLDADRRLVLVLGHWPSRIVAAIAEISSMSAPRGDPRQLQRIVLVTGNDVDVEVEDGLPGGGPQSR